jgi:hypothetical protein
MGISEAEWNHRQSGNASWLWDFRGGEGAFVAGAGREFDTGRNLEVIASGVFGCIDAQASQFAVGG